MYEKVLQRSLKRYFMRRSSNFDNLIILIFSKILQYFGKHLNDHTYLKINFLMRLGEKLDLQNPKSFQEKIQKQKLINKGNHEIKLLADKYRMRSPITRIGMAKYLNELYYVDTLANFMNLKSVPSLEADEYCMKLSNDCGSFFVAHRDNDFRLVQKKIALAAKQKEYLIQRSREYQYDLEPLVIMEKKLDGTVLDYKYFVFAGRAELLQLSDRDKLSFYRVSGEELNVSLQFDQWGKCHEKLSKKPNSRLVRSLALDAEKIANSLQLNFVRVDFIVNDTEIYLSELTFSPSSGLKKFRTENTNYCLNLCLGKLMD